MQVITRNIPRLQNTVCTSVFAPPFFPTSLQAFSCTACFPSRVSVDHLALNESMRFRYRFTCAFRLECLRLPGFELYHSVRKNNEYAFYSLRPLPRQTEHLPLRPLLVEHPAGAVRARDEGILGERNSAAAVAADVVRRRASVHHTSRASGCAAAGGNLVSFARHGGCVR